MYLATVNFAEWLPQRHSLLLFLGKFDGMGFNVDWNLFLCSFVPMRSTYFDVSSFLKHFILKFGNSSDPFKLWWNRFGFTKHFWISGTKSPWQLKATPKKLHWESKWSIGSRHGRWSLESLVPVCHSGLGCAKSASLLEQHHTNSPCGHKLSRNSTPVPHSNTTPPFSPCEHGRSTSARLDRLSQRRLPGHCQDGFL